MSESAKVLIAVALGAVLVVFALGGKTDQRHHRHAAPRPPRTTPRCDPVIVTPVAPTPIIVTPAPRPDPGGGRIRLPHRPVPPGPNVIPLPHRR